MILGEYDPKKGMMPAAVAVIVAAVALLVLAVVGVARCSAPPIEQKGAIEQKKGAIEQSKGTAATAATASQAVKVTIRRPAEKSRPRLSGDPAGAKPAHSAASGNCLSEGGRGLDEEIVIEVSQSVSAAASSEASASAAVPMLDNSGGGRHLESSSTHARLGVIVGTVPGAIALTYQVAGFEIPSGVLGARLGIGLEVEGNAQQLGAGISVGSKAFATGGGYLGWAGPGWYVGLGMRF